CEWQGGGPRLAEKKGPLVPSNAKNLSQKGGHNLHEGRRTGAVVVLGHRRYLVGGIGAATEDGEPRLGGRWHARIDGQRIVGAVRINGNALLICDASILDVVLWVP